MTEKEPGGERLAHTVLLVMMCATREGSPGDGAKAGCHRLAAVVGKDVSAPRFTTAKAVCRPVSKRFIVPAHPKPVAMTGDEFRAIIEAAGLSTTEAVELLGVCPATVYR